MITLGMLWLPILVGTVIVFVVSSLIWAVIGFHNDDWGKLPDEARVAGALSEPRVTPGQYVLPHAADNAARSSPEFNEKLKGPVGFLVVMPSGPQNMGKTMTLWAIYLVAINVLVAYLTGHTLAAGASYLEVFQVAGTAGILGYAGAMAPQAIWFGRTWKSICKEMIDGVIYGLLIAGVFGWLWPR